MKLTANTKPITMITTFLIVFNKLALENVNNVLAWRNKSNLVEVSGSLLWLRRILASWVFHVWVLLECQTSCELLKCLSTFFIDLSASKIPNKFQTITNRMIFWSWLWQFVFSLSNQRRPIDWPKLCFFFFETGVNPRWKRQIV